MAVKESLKDQNIKQIKFEKAISAINKNIQEKGNTPDRQSLVQRLNIEKNKIKNVLDKANLEQINIIKFVEEIKSTNPELVQEVIAEQGAMLNSYKDEKNVSESQQQSTSLTNEETNNINFLSRMMNLGSVRNKANKKISSSRETKEGNNRARRSYGFRK